MFRTSETLRWCAAAAALAVAACAPSIRIPFGESAPAEPVQMSGATRPAPVVAQLGHDYYNQYCASCHGVEARGDGPLADALVTPPSDLTKIAARRGGKFPRTELAAAIDGRDMPGAHGSREMPVWGERFAMIDGTDRLGEISVRGRLLALLEYLQSIQR